MSFWNGRNQKDIFLQAGSISGTPEGYDRLVTSRKTIHQWLAEFFEIDQDKIEKELAEIRAGNR